MKKCFIVVSILLCLLVHQEAFANSCDPDDVAAGTNMYTACTGVTLQTQYSATGKWNSVFSQFQRTGDPVTASSINASTGDQVFSWYNPADTSVPSTWDSGTPYRHLLATFTFPTNYVSLDFVPAREGYIPGPNGTKIWLDTGVLYAYNSSGALIKTIMVPNETQQRITRVLVLGSDIKQIRAGGYGATGGNSVSLDNLAFNSPSNLNINLSGGYLNVVDPTASLAPGASMTGSGTVGGNLSNSGIVSPGNSPGKIRIEGDYTQTNSGSLKMEIEGSIPEIDYDVLEITGQGIFDGVLDIDLLLSFMPTEGQTFDLITFGNRSGDFDQILDLNFEGGHFDWAWLDHSFRLTANLDSAPPPPPPPPSGVPEPATMLLLGLGLLGLAGVRRKIKK